MMEFACEGLIDSIYKEKNNGLLSFPDVIKMKTNNLANRLLSTFFRSINTIPSLTQNFIFNDHNLSLSPFDIIKELKNVSIMYLFSSYIIDIIDERLKFGVYFNIKLEQQESIGTFNILTPFVITNDNNITLIELKKYREQHDLIILPKSECPEEIVSHGFLLSDNSIFDEVLSKNLSTIFNIKEDDLIREFNNYKPIREVFPRSHPFDIKGADNTLIIGLTHFLDMDHSEYENIVKRLIKKTFDIIEDGIKNFDYTLHFYDGTKTREKFYKTNDNKQYDELYINDPILSQICSCIFISNGLPDGREYFVKDKTVDLEIDTLLGTVIKSKKDVIKYIELYFKTIKKLYNN